MSRSALLMILCVGLLGAAVAPAAQANQYSHLIAPGTACPGQTDLDAASAEQEQVMLCMTNFARRHSGLPAMQDSDELDRSAGRKSDDIIRCDQFSHEACRRQFTYWFKRVGYIGEGGCWRAGENIAWGSGSLGTVRSIFRAWINSEGHRENILGPFGQVGIGLEVGRLEGFSDAAVWTQHFGSHC